jgi:hypothetical protein
MKLLVFSRRFDSDRLLDNLLFRICVRAGTDHVDHGVSYYVCRAQPCFERPLSTVCGNRAVRSDVSSRGLKADRVTYTQVQWPCFGFTFTTTIRRIVLYTFSPYLPG